MIIILIVYNGNEHDNEHDNGNDGLTIMMLMIMMIFMIMILMKMMTNMPHVEAPTVLVMRGLGPSGTMSCPWCLAATEKRRLWHELRRNDVTTCSGWDARPWILGVMSQGCFPTKLEATDRSAYCRPIGTPQKNRKKWPSTSKFEKPAEHAISSKASGVQE